MIRIGKRSIWSFFALLLALSLVGLLGCSDTEDTKTTDGATENVVEKDKKKKDAKDDDDVIVAGTIDTSSQYSFSVDGAFVGMDEYSDIPVAILVCQFTNNSDKVISFGSALDAKAFQGGRSLSSAYLSGSYIYSWEDIKPGMSTPVLVAWELNSADDDVEITVTDSYHYAKEVVFKQSYTIAELLDNSWKFIEEYEGIVDEGQDLVV